MGGNVRFLFVRLHVDHIGALRVISGTLTYMVANCSGAYCESSLAIRDEKNVEPVVNENDNIIIIIIIIKSRACEVYLCISLRCDPKKCDTAFPDNNIVTFSPTPVPVFVFIFSV